MNNHPQYKRQYIANDENGPELIIFLKWSIQLKGTL
jgi:hypothetical protein